MDGMGMVMSQKKHGKHWRPFPYQEKGDFLSLPTTPSLLSLMKALLCKMNSQASILLGHFFYLAKAQPANKNLLHC